MRTIHDEFTGLAISRQRKWQMRQLRDGRCTNCGDAPIAGGTRCLKHLVYQRERQRKILKSKRRSTNSASYRLERANGKPRKK